MVSVYWRKIRVVILYGAVIVFLFSLLTWPELSHAQIRVEVFTNSQFPIENTENLKQASITVYELDDVQKTLGQINTELQELSPSTAQQMAESQLASHRDILKQDFQGLMLAKQYGIERLPTVVVNGDAQIIGQTDIGAAIQEYLSWKQKNDLAS